MTDPLLDRRQLLASGCACLACGIIGSTGRAADIERELAPGYRPRDADEQGLWMAMDEYEQELRRSNFVIRDAALNGYVSQLMCKLGGKHCADVRVYIVHTPYFNASMAPNGMMQVWSGLFLRMRSEAQLAAVLGHELGHYLRLHTLKLFRDVRSKTSMLSFLGLGAAAAGAYQLGAAAQLATIASIYGFSREAEREADAMSLSMLHSAGYDASEASRVWRQLIDEQNATAQARGRRRRDREGVLFATHPPSEARMAALAAEATRLPGGKRYRAAYLAALSPYWIRLIDDQVKLNDFGGTLYLLNSLAEDGWTPVLHYGKAELYRRRGKPGDLEEAAIAYRQALVLPNAPAEAQRGLGFVLLKLGQTDAGKAALRAYLAQAPQAPDRAMVAYMAQ